MARSERIRFIVWENALPAEASARVGSSLKNISALNDADEDNNDGDDEEDVEEAAHGGTGDESEDPKDDENNCDSV